MQSKPQFKILEITKVLAGELAYNLEEIKVLEIRYGYACSIIKSLFLEVHFITRLHMQVCFLGCKLHTLVHSIRCIYSKKKKKTHLMI